jgi:quercetin dioxygenase-like cupin family protein
MSTSRMPSGAARRGISLAGLIAGAMLAVSGTVFAGECPAGQVVADGQGQKPGATMPKDVTDVVLGSIDLATQPLGVQGRLFRMRRLAIKPGGEVPWHSHDDRPALIYVAVGQVTEYASNCAVPIVHNPGDVAEEAKGTSHWWKNTGKTTAVLISADLLHQNDDEHMM